MDNRIIGKFTNHESVAECVHHLLEIGIKKDDISLVTHHEKALETIPNSGGLFQKNGDISKETGGLAVGGVLGTLIGSLMGVATLAVPPVGVVIGAGPLLMALSGGLVGGAMGDEIVKTMDTKSSETDPLNPYIAALKEGNILCGVETEGANEESVKQTMSKYAEFIFA